MEGTLDAAVAFDVDLDPVVALFADDRPAAFLAGFRTSTFFVAFFAALRLADFLTALTAFAAFATFVVLLGLADLTVLAVFTAFLVFLPAFLAFLAPFFAAIESLLVEVI